MAKIQIVGNAAILTSAIKAEDIRLAAKYRPESLVLTKKDGNEVVPFFAIGMTDGTGKINNVGVSFDGVSRDGNGYATLTIGFRSDATGEKLKEEVADKFGIAITNLNLIEEALPAVIEEIAARKAAVVSAIEVE